MHYTETLTTRGFKLWEQCNCNGTLKQTYGCKVHPGVIVLVYPRLNAIELKYYSILQWAGPINKLEETINDTIVRAKEQNT